MFEQFSDRIAQTNVYRRLTSDVSRERRIDGQDIEVTDVQCVTVQGNYPWNIVRIRTDAGITGYGEAYVGAGKHQMINQRLERVLVGENPMDVNRLRELLFQHMWIEGNQQGVGTSSVSGIEFALLDIAGKVLETPVYQLLGGKFRDEIDIYADCHAGEFRDSARDADPEDVYSPEGYAETAAKVVDMGFDTIKFDIENALTEQPDSPAGGELGNINRSLSNADIKEKAATAEAIRERVGDEVDVAFDCHAHYNVRSSIQLAQAMEPYDLLFLEDLIPSDNPEAYERITESTTTPVLTGENLARTNGFRPFIENQAVDMLSPDLCNTGGLTEALRIAATAQDYYINIAPHNLCTPIGTLAAAHFCAAIPNFEVLQFHSLEVDWWDDIHDRPEPLISDGTLTLPDEPGLGIDVDESVLNEHAHEGQELF